jgi:hypothetical protein
MHSQSAVRAPQAAFGKHDGFRDCEPALNVTEHVPECGVRFELDFDEPALGIRCDNRERREGCTRWLRRSSDQCSELVEAAHEIKIQKQRAICYRRPRRAEARPAARRLSAVTMSMKARSFGCICVRAGK